MNVRDKIKELTDEYLSSLVNVVDGNATPEQQTETLKILESLQFYTTRLLIFSNDEIEGTEPP